MSTYVLGAGASRHAGYPLANELGDALRNWICLNKSANDNYRACVGQLFELYGQLGNFEEILTDLVECVPGSRSANIERQVRARLLWTLRESVREFFNDIRVRPASYYDQLANERVQQGDVIITFNYDVALERALKQKGLWEISDGYGFSPGVEFAPSKTKVLKLHGSTNWWALLFGGNRVFFQASNVLGVRPVVMFKAEFEFFGYPAGTVDCQCRGLDQVTGYPAIVMPILRKRFYEQTSFGREWEPFWQELWDEAARTLRASTEIVIIGYGMAVADQKARDLLLKQTNPKASVSIFCGPRSDSLCREFRDKGFLKVRTYGQGLFEDYLGLI